MLSQDIDEIDPSYYSCCRVCGMQQEDPPWGDDGCCPTYVYCNCCGVEFGYQDCLLSAIRKFRKQWTESGYKWSEPRFKPENWDPIEQMKNIPSEFR